ncbi:MAG: ThuA domain-containing protein [Acidobacteriota bacterium]|nr:ThuA domain-containing protein [Acidobacteriota bacterium]
MKRDLSVPGLLALFASVIMFLPAPGRGSDAQWVTYPGGDGPGAGYKVVLIAGDEEYRSEEAMPMLGKLLSVRHGFECVVLFSIDAETGAIDPEEQTNIPGLEALGDADLMVIATRFRELPDGQMKHIVDYVESGRPIVGLRTATHAFSYQRNLDSPYAHWSFRSESWQGGFGQQVLGDTWINHHGRHGQESTRGVVAPGAANHPILRGVDDVWGPTDVYGLRNLGDDANVLLLGAVIAGMSSDDPPVEGPKNDPMVPIAWTRSYTGAGGKTARVFTTTMGASTDFESEGLRRLLVNAVYWGLDLEDRIPERSDARVVGDYAPTDFGFGSQAVGVMPSAHELP